jgi:2,5-diamino-6-(ribosylamino)-4(3H)-pyrimidinone 5'-phosphate reductase
LRNSLRVIVNTAMTADGKIATAFGDSRISSQEDLRRLHKLRSSVDAIVVGISTVIVDNPRLSVRLVKKNKDKGKAKDPARIIIDSTARIPLDSKILQSAHKIKTIVAVSKRASRIKIHNIEGRGATVVIAGKETVDLRTVFLFLKRLGYKRILVEGGGELNWSLLRLGMVDELVITISPIIVGGRDATTLVEGKGFPKISKAIKMELTEIFKNNSGEVVLCYNVLSKASFRSPAQFS